MITEDQIRAQVAELAALINADYDRSDWGLHIVGMLKGGARLAADLARELTIDVHIDYMQIEALGQADDASARIRILKDLDRDIAGTHVLVVDNLVDTGFSMSWLLKYLESRGAASVEVCVLLRKPERARVAVPIKYVGFDIPDERIVGYALDYADRYWNLPYIGVLKPAVWSRDPNAAPNTAHGTPTTGP
ncbi:hypoxanthine phosphoribosyltransferase [Asanoa ishikariensis]|nr:hypoxanthine phosphoribosyltransferase [Asanoa ishikariensis]